MRVPRRRDGVCNLLFASCYPQVALFGLVRTQSSQQMASNKCRCPHSIFCLIVSWFPEILSCKIMTNQENACKNVILRVKNLSRLLCLDCLANTKRNNSIPFLTIKPSLFLSFLTAQIHLCPPAPASCGICLHTICIIQIQTPYSVWLEVWPQVHFNSKQDPRWMEVGRNFL